jgi:hypothetical protein
MYHAIGKRFALQNFLRVNQKDYAPILKAVPQMFITALAGITHSAASGTIVTRWDGGSNVWAGWLPRCSSQFIMYG